MQIFDPKTEIVKYFTKRISEDHQTLSEIELKFTTYDKFCQLLKESGLKSIKIYGGFNKEKFDHATSTNIIMICKRDLSRAISEAQSLIKARFSQDNLMNDLKSMRQKDF